MKPSPDPELKAKLDAALPSAEPPAVASRRIRRGIAGKVELERRFRTRAGWLVAAVAGAVVVAIMARARAPVPMARIDGGNVADASVLALRHGARVLVRAGGEVRIERDDEEGTAIELRSGVVFVSVEKRLQTSFTLRCAESTVEVVGTFFGVEAKNGTLARVGVEHGAVAVRRLGATTLLRAGESWPSGATALRPADAELAQLAPVAEPREPATEQPSPTAAIATPPPRVERTAPRESPTRKNKTLEAASDPRWQAAREYELRGDFGEAARRYRELAQSSNDLGEDALFALGRVERRQGHAADALAAFEKYRDSYPDGAYARAADLHRLELLVESGDKPGALRESTRFLRQYPADPRAWKFRQTRSSLYAEQGDCERALADIAELAENEMTRSVERRCAGRGAP